MPTQTGWFADEDIFRMDISDYSPHATARRFDAGTPPVPNIYAGVAGLGLVQETGVPADRGARRRSQHAADRRARGARRRRSSRRPTPPGAARSCAFARPMPRLSSPRSQRRTSSCSLRDANLRVAAAPLQHRRGHRHRCSTRSPVAGTFSSRRGRLGRSSKRLLAIRTGTRPPARLSARSRTDFVLIQHKRVGVLVRSPASSPFRVFAARPPESRLC